MPDLSGYKALVAEDMREEANEGFFASHPGVATTDGDIQFFPTDKVFSARYQSIKSINP